MISSFPALRFFNALLIFAHHKNAIENPYLVAFGPCAVSFFFMLSGFSMCLGYYDKVLEQGFSWKRYISKRIFRLYPLHLLCLAGWIVLNHRILIGGGYNCIAVVSNLLLLQSWIPKQSFYFSGNALSWCLSDLLFFYAVFPFFVRFIQNKKREIVFSLVLFSVYVASLPFMHGDYIHAFVYINPLFRFIDFFIGILLYRLYAKLKENNSGEAKVSDAKAGIIQMLSIVATALAIYIYPKMPEAVKYQSLFWIPSALVLLSFSLFDRKGIAKIFDNKFFEYLGKISFSFYMLHMLGISATNFVFSRCGFEINAIIKAEIQFVFVLFGSMIVNRFFEKPVCKKLEKRFLDK